MKTTGLVLALALCLAGPTFAEDIIFVDGFETGQPDRWSSRTGWVPMVVPVLDFGRAVTQTITPNGGEIMATGADLTAYRLQCPYHAVLEPTEITLTPLANVPTLPFSGGFHWGVHLEPSGLEFWGPCELVIDPLSLPDPAPDYNLLGAYSEDGVGFHMRPVLLEPGTLRIPIVHFSGAAGGVGSDDDVEMMLEAALSASETAKQQLTSIKLEAGNQPFSAAQLAQIESIFNTWIPYAIDALDPAYDCGLNPACDEFKELLQTAHADFADWLSQAMLLGIDQSNFIQQAYSDYFQVFDNLLLQVFNFRNSLCSNAPTTADRCSLFDDLGAIAALDASYGRDVLPSSTPLTMCGAFAEYSVLSVEILGGSRSAPAFLGCIRDGPPVTIDIEAEMEMRVPGPLPLDFFQVFGAGWRATPLSHGHVVDWDPSNPLETLFGGGEIEEVGVTFWVQQCPVEGSSSFTEATSSISVDVYSPLDHLQLSSTDILLVPTEIEEFVLNGYNGQGDEISNTCFVPEWSQDPSGTVSVTPVIFWDNRYGVRIEGLQSGIAQLQVSADGVPAIPYQVTVSGISQVLVLPFETTIGVGDTTIFQAVVKDFMGFEVFDRVVEWEVQPNYAISFHLTTVPMAGGDRSAVSVTGINGGTAYLSATAEFIDSNTASVTVCPNLPE